MELKYKSEWPEIIKLAKYQLIDYELILIVLALRESEDGPEGHEFNRLDSMSTTLDGQTRAVCGFIKARDREYQKYIVRLNPKDEFFDFIEYISESDEKAIKIKESLKLIKEEFETMPKEK